MDIYVFDIDGTLADCSHRLHHIQGETKDWGSFHKHMSEDKPIIPVLRVLHDLSMSAHIVYATGRQERNRLETAQWLARQTGITTDYTSVSLYMRADGDHREDTIVKPELLQRIADRFGRHNIRAVFEDRKRVCEALRKEGYTVFHVADGDY